MLLKGLSFIFFFFLFVRTVHGQYESETNRIIQWASENSESDIDGTLDRLEHGLKGARAQNDKRSEVRFLLSLSQFVLVKLNNVSKSSEYLEEIRRLADSNNDDPWILSRYFNGKGVLYYYESANKERAFASFRKSQQIIEENQLEEDPMLLNNFALAFLSDSKSAKALDLFFKARKLSLSKNDEINYSFLITNASNIGVCYIYLNQPDSSEYYFLESIKLASKTKSLSDDFHTKVYLGVFYEEKGEFNKALSILNEAEQIINYSNSLGTKSLLNQSLSNIYKNLNQFERALEYSDRSKYYDDSLRQLKLSEQAFAMDYKLELDRVKAEQKIQKLENSINDQRQKSRIFILVTALIVIVLIAFFIFYRLNKLKEFNRVKAENEYLEKERIRQQAEIDLLRKEEELIHANVELNVQKNELSELKNRLQAHLDKSYDPEFDDLKHFLKQVQKTEKKTEQLKYLDHVLSYSNSAFYSRLKELHPNLTEDEMRLATLIRLNLSSDELIQVFNISMNSLMTKRYRMRKKLDLPKESGLEEYIMSL